VKQEGPEGAASAGDPGKKYDEERGCRSREREREQEREAN